MSPQWSLLLPILIPFLGVLAIKLLSLRPNWREAASFITAGALFISVLNLIPLLDMDTHIQLIEPIKGIAIAFSLEPLGLLFSLVASSLWIITTQYAIGYMRNNKEKSHTRFFMCFSASIGATMGLALADNLFTLFVFYEMLTFCTYPLVTHHRDSRAQKGGRVYLGVLLSSSISFFLLAMLWTYHKAGTLDFIEGGIVQGHFSLSALAILFTLFMLGIGKAALMPFHRWLPNAMVAPTPVSALLHAVAVVKAGVFSVLKIGIYIFGLDTLSRGAVTDIVLYLACFTIVTSSLIALKQDNLKARLAYSTISQLSYVTVGVALASSSGLLGGALQIPMHAFGKITLFFCAGAIYTTTHKSHISTMDGLGRQMPITFFCFLIGSLSIIGLPPLGGSWVKWYLMLGAVEADKLFVIAVLLISSLLNIAYLIPIVIRGFLMPNPDGDNQPKEAPLNMVMPLSITALTSVLLFFFADSIEQLIAPIVK